MQSRRRANIFTHISAKRIITYTEVITRVRNKIRFIYKHIKRKYILLVVPYLIPSPEKQKKITHIFFIFLIASLLNLPLSGGENYLHPLPWKCNRARSLAHYLPTRSYTVLWCMLWRNTLWVLQAGFALMSQNSWRFFPELLHYLLAAVISPQKLWSLKWAVLEINAAIWRVKLINIINRISICASREQQRTSIRQKIGQLCQWKKIPD